MARRSSKPDHDTITTLGKHTVCWRAHGTDSPNAGKISVIVKHGDAWVNIGTWDKGPINVNELTAMIEAVVK